MKTTQDNSDRILRDKINSVDSLPDGYTPSLDSKWELLMAGMQPAEPKNIAIKKENNRKRFMYMYATAACFLAIFTFGWLLIKDDKITGNQDAVVAAKLIENKAAMPRKPGATTQITLSEKASQITLTTKETPRPAEAKKRADISKPTSKFAASANKSKPYKTVVEQTKITTTAAPTKVEISVQSEQLLAVAALSKTAKAKAAVSKKVKTVEVDFGPSEVIIPSKHNPQVAQQNLKFKFFPITESGNVAQHDSPLKLKHTF